MSPVLAHTELISVEPSPDKVILTLPSEVKLTFGEAIIADATFASITSESGSLAQAKAEPAASPTEEIVEEEVVAISAPVEPNSSNISWLQWLSLGASIGIAITFFLKMRKK